MDEWQTRQLRAIGALFHDGMCVADIGASRGEFIAPFVNLLEVGLIPKYYAFEPNIHNVEYITHELTTTVDRAGQPQRALGERIGNRLELIPCAVSSENGTASFFAPFNSPQEGNLLGHDVGRDPYTKENSDIFTVDTVTLDTFFEYRQVDLIKIDVEGAEWDVLKGATKLLNERDIIWQIEFHYDEDWYPNVFLDAGLHIYDLDFNCIDDRQRRIYQAIICRKEDMSAQKEFLRNLE